jgi:hypothetical protein
VLPLALSLASLGCNATCIRDSDCLGRSLCSENRCILIVGRDAGNSSSTSPDDTGNDVTNGSDASSAPRDAGN